MSKQTKLNPAQDAKDKTNGSTSSVSKIFFSQLRHLASEIDNGVQSLQQQIESRKTPSACQGEKAQAMNIMLHTRKELTSLRDKVQVEKNDFAMRNSSMDRIQQLMASVLATQAERLENIESYIEKYGYVRPSFEVADKNTAGEDDEETEKDDDVEATAQDDDETEEQDNSCPVNESGEGRSPRTPPPHAGHAVDKTANQFIMRTPRLEDLYKNLSEETIVLMKQGPVGGVLTQTSARQQAASCHENPVTPSSNMTKCDTTPTIFLGSTPAMKSRGESPETPTLLTPGFKLNKVASKQEPTSESDTSKNAAPSMPELPKLLTQGLVLNDVDRTLLLSSGGAFRKGEQTQPTISSATRMNEPAPVKTPESPTLLTPGFKLGNIADNVTEKKEGKSARALFNTPPLPELQTCELTGYNFTSYGASAFDNKENEFTSSHKSSHIMSTPEPPKLLTHNLDWSSFLGYGTGNNNK